MDLEWAEMEAIKWWWGQMKLLGGFFNWNCQQKIARLRFVILLVPEEKNGEGGREFDEAIIKFVEEGSSKGKRREMFEAADMTDGKKSNPEVAVAVVEGVKCTQPFWYKKNSVGRLHVKLTHVIKLWQRGKGRLSNKGTLKAYGCCVGV